MNTKRQKLKNRLKNAVLLVLFVGMLVLTVLTWVADLSLDSIPGDSLFARFHQKLTYGISGFEIRTGDAPAAEPTRVAVTGANGLMGAQYHAASVSLLYDALAEHMGAALAASEAFADCTAADFAAALRTDVIYFGYEGYMPLALISDWLGREASHTAKTDLLLLTAGGRLFIHNEKGYQTAHTSAGLTGWDAAEPSGSACMFAASDALYAQVRPDTLLLESETTEVQQLAMRQIDFFDAQSGSDLTALLDAFGYDPHVLSYTENAGTTRVFVDNYSTLRMRADGEVIFRASADGGGIEAYSAVEAVRPQDGLRLLADFAYKLVKGAQGSISDELEVMLFDVAEGQNGVRVLTFIRLQGGIPVQTEQPFARLEFRDEQLMTARFHLRKLETTGVRGLVLPGKQAAAAAAADGLRQALVYIPAGENSFAAQRVYIP